MDVMLESSSSVSSLPESDQRPSLRMSNPGLTTEAQLRYILQWFGEFSELQREDFLPVLAAAKTGKPDLLAEALAKLSCEDKPISLFQCRIKLFNEWYPTWTEEENDRLVKGVSEMDEDFGLKLQDLITNGKLPNGDTDGMNGFHESDDSNEGIVNDNADVNGILEPNEEQNLNQDNIPIEIAAAS